MRLKAPFPWFGGKSRAGQLVWNRFGDVPNYVEPFFGSGAVLLGRPYAPRTETVNDKDGFVANAWRAIAMVPTETAEYADWPVNENDLHARHAWLIERRDQLSAHLEGDPDYYDAKIAGWWLWGMACWIGSEFCSGKGPWRVVEGKLVNDANSGQGNRGQGVQRQLVHLGSRGQGVKRQRVHLGDRGRGVQRQQDLGDYFNALQNRMRNVRVCCGDWLRVLGDTPTIHVGLTGVFLDPPYSAGVGRSEDIYAIEDTTIAAAVRLWAIEHGRNPLLRIAVCGYEGEHEFPDSWTCVAWKAKGGYGRSNGNETRERIWFSPHCLRQSEQSDWLDAVAILSENPISGPHQA